MVIVYDTTLKERISSITFEEERYINSYSNTDNLYQAWCIVCLY